MNTQQQADQLISVFIDTDAGWDDWCAIALLALADNISIKGIAVNGCGESYLEWLPDRKYGGFNNIRNLLALAGKESVPVYKGSAVPTSFYNVFPHAFKSLITTLLNVDVHLPTSSARVESDSGLAGLKKAVAETPYLTYLSIGGFSGLASYLDDPANYRFRRIVAMGGAVKVPGNLPSLFSEAYPYNKTAEWNMFVDPGAAAKVFADDSLKNTEIVMVTLDATEKVELTSDVVDSIKTTPGTVAEFIHAVLKARYDEAQKGGYSEYFYDPLAAMYIINPGLGERTPGDFSISDSVQGKNEYEENRLGAMAFQAGAGNHSYLVPSDSLAPAFYRDFKAIINQES